MNRFIMLWKCSRPHTVIGSISSIFSLFVIICEDNKMQHLPLLMLALLIGVSTNVFIVGINQISDIHIDTINKPYLPIPSGSLSIQQAKAVVLIALCISLGLALYVSRYLFVIILLSITLCF